MHLSSLRNCSGAVTETVEQSRVRAAAIGRADSAIATPRLTLQYESPASHCFATSQHAPAEQRAASVMENFPPLTISSTKGMTMHCSPSRLKRPSSVRATSPSFESLQSQETENARTQPMPTVRNAHPPHLDSSLHVH